MLSPTSCELSCFQNEHVFYDDVHGKILLNSLERDIIDTPEFQRLFRSTCLPSFPVMS